jgi:hypothetical protein
MRHQRAYRSYTAGLTLGLAFVLSPLGLSQALAQPLSSGSGAGTGTGLSGGAARNSTGTGQQGGIGTGTGSESGIGPGGLRNRMEMIPGRGFENYPRLAPRLPGSYSIPMGSGAGSGLPGDSPFIRLDAIVDVGGLRGSTDFSTVKEQHLKYALQIPIAGDRSLALSRIASAATFSSQLDLASQAVIAASTSALEIPLGMVRDQRLIATITAMLNLAETRLREGTTNTFLPEPTGSSPSALPKMDRNQMIRKALDDWRRAASLSEHIGNPTYRNEMFFRVADSMGIGSQTIVVEFPKEESNGTSKENGKEASGFDTSYAGLPDKILKDAADLAARIDRPVWHDRTLVTVATAAAESRQFARALSVARLIPQPEVRTDALLKIAEKQARGNDPKGATATYKEAALAVSSIPLDDPRDVLTGVLIDNLISVGRFEDARASVNLYAAESLKMIALGAIAESQGRRGAAPEAIAWINREIPPEKRSVLYRRVSNGVVSAIEQNRSRDQSARER